MATQIFAWLAHLAVKLIVAGIERPAGNGVHHAPAPSLVHEQRQAVEAFAAQQQPKAAPRLRKRSARTAPTAMVEQAQAWAREALVSRSGAAVAAADVFAAFQVETGADISQAAFGAAMADTGFNKAKRGGRVVYTGVAFRQALGLQRAHESFSARHGGTREANTAGWQRGVFQMFKETYDIPTVSCQQFSKRRG